MTRDQQLTRKLDHTRMRGVEIAPWYAPIAPRAGGWRTMIIDAFPSEELRERATTHSDAMIRSNAYRIEDVDIVWRGQPLDEAILEHSKDPVDFVIGSHVLEHVPDLIRTLQQLRRAIRPDGIISLAMPDCRYCFDYYKPLTLTDAALRAYREKRTRHTPETLFQAFSYQGWRGASAAWMPGPGEAVTSAGSLFEGFRAFHEEQRANAESPYVDAHAWVFVPSSFCLMILELGALDLVDLHIDHLETQTGGSEFIVQLAPGRAVHTEAGVEAERRRLLAEMVVEHTAR